MDSKVRKIIIACVAVVVAGGAIALSVAMNHVDVIYAGTVSDTQQRGHITLPTEESTQGTGSDSVTATSGEEREVTSSESGGTASQSRAGGTSGAGSAVTAQTDISKLTDAQLIDAAQSAVNAVKQLKSFTAVKDQTVAISLSDCSVPALTGAINSIIKKLAQDRVTEYTFSGGTATVDGVSATADEAIPPTSRNFVIDPDGVKSVTAESSGSSTVYTITLKEESTTLQKPVPEYRSQCMDYLDIANYDLGAVKITKADITYEEATITVTVGADGKITEYREYMPISGTGEGTLGVSVSGTLGGYLDETWKFTY